MAPMHNGDPIRMTSADEAAGREKIIENLKKGAFEDWPNEAGFEGLTEHRGPIELKVEGTIPIWSVGSLYRTGPGICEVETKTGTFHISHWFDGLAHSHKFDIIAADGKDGKDGKDGDGDGGKAVTVLYSSRRQSAALEQDIKNHGDWRGISFGQKRDPCIGLFAKAMSMWTPKPEVGNVCVTVNTDMPGFEPKKTGSQGHRASPQTVVLATDAAWFSEIDASTLEPMGTVRQQSLHPDLQGDMSAAHGQRDPKTGDFFNYNLEMGMTSKYRVFQVPSHGRTKILATIQNAPGSYIHSFFLTENYVVLCVPVAAFGKGGLDIMLERNVLDAIEPFDKDKSCQWFLIDRHHGRGVVAEFTSMAAFFFHSVNAFEENGDVFCDLVEYGTTEIIFAFYYDVLLNRKNSACDFWAKGNRLTDAHPRLVRYAFPMKHSEPKKGWLAASHHRGSPVEVLSIPAPHAGELPTINPLFHCRKHRYMYSLPSRGLSTLFDTIVKTDTLTREAVMWNGPAGHSPGEPIFVPRPSADGTTELDEDDGVLLSVVLDGANKTSYLLCLDAKTMKELGRAECEFAVPFGFHGQHVPQPSPNGAAIANTTES